MAISQKTDFPFCICLCISIPFLAQSQYIPKKRWSISEQIGIQAPINNSGISGPNLSGNAIGYTTITMAGIDFGTALKWNITAGLGYTLTPRILNFSSVDINGNHTYQARDSPLHAFQMHLHVRYRIAATANGKWRHYADIFLQPSFIFSNIQKGSTELSILGIGYSGRYFLNENWSLQYQLQYGLSMHDFTYFQNGHTSYPLYYSNQHGHFYIGLGYHF